MSIDCAVRLSGTLGNNLGATGNDLGERASAERGVIIDLEKNLFSWDRLGAFEVSLPSNFVFFARVLEIEDADANCLLFTLRTIVIGLAVQSLIGDEKVIH